MSLLLLLLLAFGVHARLQGGDPAISVLFSYVKTRRSSKEGKEREEEEKEKEQKEQKQDKEQEKKEKEQEKV